MLAEFGPDDETSAFALIARERPDAVVVGSYSFATGKRDVILAFATRYRLPLMTSDRIFTDAGGLMSYSPKLIDSNRVVADYVDRILRGAKPGDLPIQQATLELVVNLKTAKAFGLRLPESFLLRADEVIR